MKNIFFVYNSSKEEIYSTVKEVLEFLKSKDVNIYTECEKIKDEYSLEMINEEALKDCAVVIILGGDGTILKFCREYGKYEIPVLGINLGRVGALASMKLTNYKELIEKYLSSDFYVAKNLTLKCSVNYKNGNNSEEFLVYNDVVLHRGAFLQMLPLEVSIDNTKFDTIYADGIIVATPSGSSAYNFSAGGPLLSHGSNCYVITPVCSQTRDFSSLVVSREEKVTLKVKEASPECFLTIDGSELHPLTNGDVVMIEQSGYTLNIVNFYRQDSIYETVYKVMSSNKKANE